MPTVLVSDLWEVRNCFHEHYRHRPNFIVAEEDNVVLGFLPLSWNEETGQYNYFPGETWEGKTWLEQNRVIADSQETLDAMLAVLDGPHHLRYLRGDFDGLEIGRQVDEIGYLFLPENYNFDIDQYFLAFSHKTAKKLRKELDSWNSHQVEYRIDRIEDFELLCQMNLKRYGETSYFHDERFLAGFKSLVNYLYNKEWIRIVTILVDGEPAAVDMGSLFNGMLTMLAGGVNDKFRGIAKLINMHHMSFACQQKFDSVDFLCGDFNWKTQFHLTPTPLYLLEGEPKLKYRDRIVRPHFSMDQLEENSGVIDA